LAKGGADGKSEGVLRGVTVFAIDSESERRLGAMLGKNMASTKTWL
jgi:hypothetical protein